MKWRNEHFNKLYDVDTIEQMKKEIELKFQMIIEQTWLLRILFLFSTIYLTICILAAMLP